MHACISNHFFYFVLPVSLHYNLKQWNYIPVWSRQSSWCNTECLSTCAVSHRISLAFHNVFQSLSWRTYFTSLTQPADYQSKYDLNLLILISRHSKFQKAHWIMSVISISRLCWSFTLVSGQSRIIGFLNLRLSALPDRFGEIKIFPVQWINIETTLPLTLKMC